tara:strand:+ start:585 stop:992 length:408 start_codon:yes stop_codon:yes gene_type:complete
MVSSQINSLNDLSYLRSAPILNDIQTTFLYNELMVHIQLADWFTVGIMAPSSNIALQTLRNIENCLNWESMIVRTNCSEEGPVFLKANQETGDVHIRIEFGLGKGVLISCQNYKENQNAETFGPFPLDFFNSQFN